MTAGERLRSLAGVSGTAATLLILIGSGGTTGAALVNYSGLAIGTAAQHLLRDKVVQTPSIMGGGSGGRILNASLPSKIRVEDTSIVLSARQRADDEIILQVIIATTQELLT